MATKRRDTTLYSVEGTSVRQMQTYELPLELPEEERRGKRRRVERPYSDRERVAKVNYAPVIDVFAMFILAFSIAIAVYSSISFLNIQADISDYEKKISSIEREMESLKIANDYTELKIEKSIDYDTIFEVATTELGMIYPYENQKVSYKYEKKGYVRQYGELLGNEKESVVESLLRMMFNKNMW